jgi:hypothetical protein
MWRFPTRLAALALLALLVAAQTHVWMESSPARTPGHVCQVCMLGTLAILSAAPALDVAPASLRLEAERARPLPSLQRAEASAPRAPPYA